MYYNPTLFSNKITENKEIIIPQADKFSIHFYVEKGDIEIYYDSLRNLPGLKLYTGAKWNMRCLVRTVNRVFVRGENFVVWVIIERL